MAVVQAFGDSRRMGAVADELSVCALAAQALATGNAAGPGLRDKCGAQRAINVAAGNLVVDALPPDADLRVNLASTGEHIISGTPQFGAIAAKLSADARRGYAIGIKVVSAIGGYDPAYAAWISSGMSSANAQGFALATAGVQKGQNGLSSSSVTAVNPTSTSSGIPTAVYVGGGVVLAVGVAALIYKFAM